MNNKAASSKAVTDNVERNSEPPATKAMQPAAALPNSRTRRLSMTHFPPLLQKKEKDTLILLKP